MTALIIVDIQKDFCPGGSLAVKNGDSIIETVNLLVKAFRKAALPIFCTRDWHPADHCSFKKFGGIWPEHCIAKSSGAKFHDDLKIPDNAIIISKAETTEKDAYSGFEGTDLDKRLKRLGVNRIIIAGLATDYCVKNTVLDALKAGYSVFVAKDGIRAVDLNPGDGEAALKTMREHGAWLSSTFEIINDFI